ncbi:MAG TPA: DALR domain-containing protein, partial [Methylovirgula sp.]
LDRWYGRVETTSINPHAKPRPDFLEALDDDLNTPAAIAKLYSLFSSSRLGELELGVSELGWDIHDPDHAAVAVASARMLGIMRCDPMEWKSKKLSDLQIDEIFVAHKIKERLDARQARDWAASDRIRDELAAIGVALKDNKDGTTSWEVKR